MEETREVDVADGQGFAWSRSSVIVLIVLCLAPLLEYIDMTVVNVALPAVRADLGFALPDLQWVINAYTICFGGFFLLAGRAGDLFGRRRVFLAGVAAFTLASLASGLAPSLGLLIGARAVQGLAAAFVVPLTLAMIAAEFPEGKPRNIALTAWGTTTAISASLGLVAGGLLATGPGWRWIFYVNLPAGVVILFASWRYLHGGRPARRHRTFDVAAALTSTAGLCLLTYAVVQTGTHPWHSARTIGLLAGAGALLACFVVRELVFAAEPLLPFSLLRNRAVSGANAVSALSGAGLVSVFYFATLYQQQVLGYSALQTGLAVISTVATSRISRRAAAGHPAADALSSGFRLAFAITAALLAAAAVFALVIFRNEGRGEHTNLAEVTRAGIES